MPMMMMMGKGDWGKGKEKGKPKQRLSTFKHIVWLGGIPDSMKYEKPSDEGHKKLKQHMNQAGKCIFVSVTRGQGGCAYSTADEAANAVATLNGSEFEGAMIEVDTWTKME